MPKSMSCPAGHELPHSPMNSSAQCTPVFCSEGKLEKQLKKVKSSENLHPDILTTSESTLAESAADVRIAIARGEESARQKILKTPHLEGAEAEEWADAKILTLLPRAVSEIEWGLRFGDADTRARAASKVLDATGRGKKENGAMSVAPIILLQGSQIPWLQRSASEPNATPHATTPRLNTDGEKT